MFVSGILSAFLMQHVYSMFVMLLLVLQAEAVTTQGHTTPATQMEEGAGTGTMTASVASRGAMTHLLTRPSLFPLQDHQSMLRSLALSQHAAT